MIQLHSLQNREGGLSCSPFSNNKKAKSIIEKLGVVVACIVLLLLFYSIFIYYYVSEYGTSFTEPTLPSSSNATSNGTADNNITSCEPSFVQGEDSYCYPSCSEWSVDSEALKGVLLVVKSISMTVGGIACLVALLFSVYENNYMFKFPARLVIFILLDYLLLTVFLAISVLGGQLNLFCTDNRFDVSIMNNPSLYCTVSGILFYYVTTQMTCFWLTHVSFFFYFTVFPFHARKTKKSQKRAGLALLVVVLGFVAPGVLVLVVLIGGGANYTLTDSSTSFCILDDVMYQFYLFVFPNIVMLSIGGVILVVTLQVVNKYHGIFSKKLVKSLRRPILSNTDKKTLLVFGSLIIYEILILLYSTHQGINRSRLTSVSETYFACHRLGPSNSYTSACDHSMVETYSSSYVALVAYIFSPVLPLSILAYVTNVKHLKEACNGRRNEDYVPPPPPSTTAQRLHLSQTYILTPREMDVSQTIIEEEGEEEDM